MNHLGFQSYHMYFKDFRGLFSAVLTNSCLSNISTYQVVDIVSFILSVLQVRLLVSNYIFDLLMKEKTALILFLYLYQLIK